MADPSSPSAWGGAAGSGQPLPTGTVTFLFTDIEGSTKLAQAHPAEWESVRQRHHAILRAAAEARQGHVFQIVGDAFCISFHNTTDAVAAAVSTQRTLNTEAWGETPIRVRIGLHTGAAEFHDGDYHGYLTLAHVQRVMSAAHGGQTLVSNASAGLLAGHLPAGLTLRDLGEHRLKGLLNPERLWQVVAPDLPQDFPPLQSLNTIPNNLPIQLTSFVGREKEVAELKVLLLTTRLLTLTGSGGVGKTRLTLQIAAEALDSFKDGVWFIELAPLADPAFIPALIASVLGLQEQPDQPLLSLLSDFFHARTALLILDNCEHLIAACATVVDRLLHAAPKLTVVASSREALGIAGETAYRVPSLGCPTAAQALKIPVDSLRQYEAARLFVERAAQAVTTFKLSDANAPAIAQICSRLDGIPLAIELAAVRVKLLSPEQIAARLDDRFRMLTGGSRTALPRQQTLRALVDWSYSLLSEAERVLLQRLAVFAGGWSLEAAQAVCGADTVDEYELLDLLAHLVDKSLVMVENRMGGMRYRMLETIRQYAREKLLDSGQGESVRDEHLQHYMRFAETAELKLQGPEQVDWLNQLETELDNIRAAIEWSLQRDDTTPGLRLASALWWFWFTHSHHAEGTARLRELLARPDAHKRTALRAKSLLTANSLSRLISGYSEADLPTVEEALSIGHEVAEPFIVARSLVQMVFLAVRQEDYARASSLLDESIAIFQTCGLRWHVAQALNSKGSIAARQGNRTAALAAFAQSAEILRELGDKNMLAPPLRGLARLELADGDIEQAAVLFAESLSLIIDVGDARGILCSLAGMVSVFVARGDFVRAAQLAAAIVALEDSRHTRLLILERDFYAHAVETLRAQLHALAFERAWSEGRAMSMEHAIALALKETDG